MILSKKFNWVFICVCFTLSIFGWSNEYLRTVKVQEQDKTINIEVQTLARTLINKTTGAKVCLVSTFHVGMKDYYHEIQKILNDSESVIYEGIGFQKRVTQALKEEKPFFKFNARRKNLHAWLSVLLNTTTQSSTLKYYVNDRWENIDMQDNAEFLKLEKLPKLKIAENIREGEQTFIGKIENFNGLSLIQGIELFMYGKMLKTLVLGTDKVSAHVPIRNDLVLKHAKQIWNKNPDKSITIFYGLGHMPDFQKKLIKNFNFEIDHEHDQWLPAFKKNQMDYELVMSCSDQKVFGEFFKMRLLEMVGDVEKQKKFLNDMDLKIDSYKSIAQLSQIFPKLKSVAKQIFEKTK